MIFKGIKHSISQKKIISSYSGYIKAIHKSGINLSSIKECSIYGENGNYISPLTYNQNLYYFPATLWQLYSLNGKEKWKTLAEDYNTIFSNHKIPIDPAYGELIQNSLLTSFKLSGNQNYYLILSELLSHYLYDNEKNTNTCKNQKGELRSPEKLLENQLLFFATEMTGDPLYRDLALKQSETIYNEHFKSDHSHEIFYGIVNWKTIPKVKDLKLLEEKEFYLLSVSLYAYTLLYNETDSEKYYQLIYRLTEIFSSIFYDSKDNIPSKQYVISIRNKINFLSRIITCLAFANMKEEIFPNQNELRNQIFDSVLHNLNESPEVTDSQYSFRMYYYLMEYLKQMQQKS